MRMRSPPAWRAMVPESGDHGEGEGVPACGGEEDGVANRLPSPPAMKIAGAVMPPGFPSPPRAACDTWSCGGAGRLNAV